MKHTPEEIKYRLSDLGVQIGNIAIEYIEELEKENAGLNNFIMQSKKDGISPINALIIKNLGNRIEELEKEAKENQIYVGEYCSYNHLVKAYLAGALPREKQIQTDAEQIRALQKDKGELTDRVRELEELIEKYRQAVDKCLHITFMGGGCEVNTIGQYATLVDGYLTDVEGLAKWKK